jgi:hypothetical protein
MKDENMIGPPGIETHEPGLAIVVVAGSFQKYVLTF